jgi:nicotinamidase-related amidase
VSARLGGDLVETVEKFRPEVAALLVVDVQNDFCHPDGVMAQEHRDVHAAVAMVPRLERLVDEARMSSVPVVWIRTTHDDLTNSAVWLARRSTTLRTSSPPRSTCWTGGWGADFYELAPHPLEPVVTKHRYSGFAGTSLDWVLRSLERRSLLVAGVATDTCVESTVRDGLFHDYHVNLVADCCAAYSEPAHEATIDAVRRNFGLVVTSSDLVGQWHQGASGDHLVARNS